MEILDPIERGEARIESWYYDNVKDGQFKCDCGKMIRVENGVPSSADPYSSLICDECAGFDEFLERENKNE